MGRWQPYLYNAPTRESFMDVPDQFNPKAVTHASREPSSPRKKAEGPLVNINQHPDSYLILPYGKTDAKPMNPKVKAWIKTARWTQLVFRVPTFFGAVGALLCGIFIKGAQDTAGYVMRVTPGVDLAFTLYAIYHLIRAAKARPAASSASYHFFALVTDAGFIPFYAFTAILAKRSSDTEAGTVGRWRTFFPADEDTDKVLLTTWLTVTALAGLHCLAMVMDLYLVLVFRKIAQLPPDMNPLEDNLTSRRKTKHKHKNSSISAIQPLTAEEKRISAQSGVSTIVGSRYSATDPLMAEKDILAPDANKMAFIHTRNNSDMVYSPHNPKSAHQSRQSVYSGPGSARQSRGDLNTRDDLHRRDDVDDDETLAQRKSFLAQKAIKRSSRPNSFVSSKQDYYTPPSTADNDDASGDLSMRNSRENIQSDNWFVYHDSTDDPAGKPRGSPNKSKDSNGAYAPLPYPTDDPFCEDQYSPVKQSMFTPKKTQGYNALSTSEDLLSDNEYDYQPPMVPQPLRMNPPSPPPTKASHEPPTPASNDGGPMPMPAPPTKSFLESGSGNTPTSALKRTMTTTSISSASTFNRSPTRTGTPKTRYYGDLKAATKGVKDGTYSPAQSPSMSPTKGGFTPNHLPSSARQYVTNQPSTSPVKEYGVNLHSPGSPVKAARAYPAPGSPTKIMAKGTPISLDKKTYASVRRTGDSSYTPVQAQSPRVVSRTGVDYMDVSTSSPYDDYDDVSDLGSGRRDVSGKIAEEGRGGMAGLAGRWGGMRGNTGLSHRKVSGVS